MAQALITEQLPEISAIVRECPTSLLIRAYAASAREFCNRSRWLRMAVTGVTEASTPQYTIGNDTYHEVCGIRAMSIRASSTADWVPLTERSGTTTDPNADEDVPEFYQYLPHGKFRLSATPLDVYDLSITVVVQPKKGVVSIDESLLIDWDEALRHGAMYRLLRISGQPWTDGAESNNQRTLFEVELNKAKSAAAVGYNAGAATTNRPGRPNATARSRILPI
jgi:hypothetical protein